MCVNAVFTPVNNAQSLATQVKTGLEFKAEKREIQVVHILVIYTPWIFPFIGVATCQQMKDDLVETMN